MRAHRHIRFSQDRRFLRVPLRSAAMLLPVLALGLRLTLAATAADAPTNLVFWSGTTMGSAYSIKIAHTGLKGAAVDRLRQQVDKCLEEVNRQMSHYQPDSELSRFNRSRSTEPFPVSPGFAAVVRYSLRLNRESQGAFDPTLGPLINLWGFGQAGAVVDPPTPGKITEVLRRTGCRHLAVTDAPALRKTLPELELNLSAVAAGFAADEVARLLTAAGHTNFFVNITGELVTSGVNPDRRPWRVGVQRPVPGAAEGQDLEAVVVLSGRALATSGDYRKFFADAQGRQYSHILNPVAGRPIEHSLASVTVVAGDCLTADGLSTTLFVLGPEAGLRWIEKQPGASALFIVREPDGRLRKFASARFPEWTDLAAPERR